MNQLIVSARWDYYTHLSDSLLNEYDDTISTQNRLAWSSRLLKVPQSLASALMAIPPGLLCLRFPYVKSRILPDRIVIYYDCNHNPVLLGKLGEDDLIEHQFIIGTLLNELANPHVVITVGLRMVDPIRDPITDNIIDLDSPSDGIHPALFTEVIPGSTWGDTARELLTQLGVDGISKLLLQVILTLEQLQHHYRFTHYDLNAYNIIITPVINQTRTYIRPTGQSITFSHSYRAVIIDFELSRIEYNNEVIGVDDPEYLRYNISSQFHGYHDIYKLLCSLGKCDKSYHSFLTPLLAFFSSDPVSTIIETQDRYLYSYLLPSTGTITDFVDYYLQCYPVVPIPIHPRDNVMVSSQRLMNHLINYPSYPHVNQVTDIKVKQWWRYYRNCCSFAMRNDLSDHEGELFQSRMTRLLVLNRQLHQWIRHYQRKVILPCNEDGSLTRLPYLLTAMNTVAFRLSESTFRQ